LPTSSPLRGSLAPVAALAGEQDGYPENARIEWARGAAREVVKKKGIDLRGSPALNGDDVSNFVFDIRIRSNRYPAIVRESAAPLRR